MIKNVYNGIMSTINLFEDAEFGISADITGLTQTATQDVSLGDQGWNELINDVSATVTFAGTDFEFAFTTKSTPLLGLSINADVSNAAADVVKAYADALDTIWHAYETSGEFYCASGSDISEALDNLILALTSQYTHGLSADLCDSSDPSDYVTINPMGTLGGWDNTSLVSSKSITFTLQNTSKILGLESGTEDADVSLNQANYPNIVNAIKDTTARGEAGSRLTGTADFSGFEQFILAIPIEISLTNNISTTAIVQLDYTSINTQLNEEVTVGVVYVNNDTLSGGDHDRLVKEENKTYLLTSTASRTINFTTGDVSYNIDGSSDNFDVSINEDFTINDSDLSFGALRGDISNVQFAINSNLAYDGQEGRLGTLPVLTSVNEGVSSNNKIQSLTVNLEIGLTGADRNTLESVDCLRIATRI